MATLVRIDSQHTELYQQREKHLVKIRKDHFKNTSDFQGRTGSATLNMDRLSLHIDNMISNYNYPELAVLREWVSNAHDAHVAAGIKRPVKVTLPSQLNPSLVVQDFGHGMTADFVENVYLDFGSSTKGESNDEIGGFGQGGKSALAIASQYTMTTIAGGLKNIYIFERSPLGGVDYKLVIEDEPTDEESGVTVQVAVDRIDQYSEVNLNRVLAGWSNGDISLNSGKPFYSIPDNGTAVDYTIDLTDYSKENEPGFAKDIRPESGYVINNAFDLTGDIKGLSSAMKLAHNEFVVLVGPVAYIFQPETTARGVLKDYMVASVGIGDVTFPSSREVIEGSRANRIVVGKCLEKIVAEADKILQLKANSLADRKTALTLHRSPLAQNRKDFKITFKDEVIPTTFKPKSADSIIEYQSTGGWRGVTGYKLVEAITGPDSEIKLLIETLVIHDDDSSVQSVRNNARIRHTAEGHDPKELSGYLVISKNPDPWLKAAAKTVIKATELATMAREYRKKKRDEAAAAAAAGISLPATGPVRKTRRDRIGEYSTHWLNFGTDAEGKFIVDRSDSDLMDFVSNVFDPKKTLVLSTDKSDYSPRDFMPFFQSFKVSPKDAQFLRVHTGSKIETLRILFGDEVKIMELGEWIEANFAKLASFKGRSPQEISRDLPISLDSSLKNLLEEIGVDTLHPKYAEIIAASKELEESQRLIGNQYYSGASRLIRKVMDNFEQLSFQDRPEFFFLENLSYYRGKQLKKREKPAIRHTLNQMVETWLDNLALEEAEAEEAAEEAKKAEAQQASLAASQAN